MNRDFLEFIEALKAAGASFLIVGAHALAIHGVPRATGDLDVWIEPSDENARRVFAALEAFGAPTDAIGVSEADLRAPGMVVQIGLPPRRIDVLTRITAVDFADAWEERVVRTIDDLAIPFIGREALIRNKRETGRTKDMADVEALEARAGY